MIPVLAELLLAANLTVGAAAAPPHVDTLSASPAPIAATAVRSLHGRLTQVQLDTNCGCHTTACGCNCKPK